MTPRCAEIAQVVTDMQNFAKVYSAPLMELTRVSKVTVFVRTVKKTHCFFDAVIQTIKLPMFLFTFWTKKVFKMSQEKKEEEEEEEDRKK